MGPCDTKTQPVLGLNIQPPHTDQGLDQLRIPVISKRVADNSLGFWDLVQVSKRNGVSIRVNQKRVAFHDKVRNGAGHHLVVGDLYHLSIFQEGGCVSNGSYRNVGGDWRGRR